MSQGDARVLSPQSSRDELKDEIRVRGIDMVGVIDACKIANGIYSTGEMGTIIKEQPLIIRTGDGLITLTGCAHPGIVEIVSKAVGLFGGPVRCVLGGFHLLHDGRTEMRSIA